MQLGFFATAIGVRLVDTQSAPVIQVAIGCELRSMEFTRPLRFVAALAALIAGYAHISLYNQGYKDIPVGNIGVQFLLNALSAVVIAVGLLAPVFVTKLPPVVRWAAPAAGVVWAATSLLAFFVARTDSGWFGFVDMPGLNPSPEAQLSVFPEIIVVLTCSALLATTWLSRSVPATTHAD
ncbi:MAG TPA: hypothetical protein VLN74_15930 [Ilumatobacteraceae bacterium]|nr:hypothetical protein [Ilumatobacteraceae bacterium]